MVRFRRALACALIASTFVAVAPAQAGPTRVRRARLAVHYLVSQQQASGAIVAFSPLGSTADAVVSMVAARRAPRAIREAVTYLRENLGDIEAAPANNQVGLRAKVVLAVVAAGRNPRDFGGRNLVRAIRATQDPAGRYGSETYVIGQALAILALEAAGVDPSAAARRWLSDAQCGDGGWQFDEPSTPDDDEHCFNGASEDFSRSDTNTTSYAVQALAATGRLALLAANPFPFFRTARDTYKLGWVYDPASKCTDATLGSSTYCALSDTNSTSLVIQAYAAAGKDTPTGGLRALKDLQYRPCGSVGGAFAYSWTYRDGRFHHDPPRSTARSDDPAVVGGVVGATIAGILGLLEQPLPVPPRAVTLAAPQAPRC